MSRSTLFLAALVAATALTAGGITAQQKPSTPKAAGNKEANRAADEEAIRKQAREFEQAFAKGDAKALAAGWTDQAEYNEDGGPALRGRAAIEQAFTTLFQEHPGAQMLVQIDSIRFPSRDTALEEGVLTLKFAGAELPSSSRYRVLHVREDGQWRTAMCREWGSDEDRLHDLAWLVGDWVAKSPDAEVRLNYAWNETKSCIEGRFTTKKEGQPAASGSQRIIRDPQTGQLHSWIFDDNGGHGQTDWVRDGNRWVLHAAGVTADGANTTATNVLTRLSDDEYLWRSVNRAVDGNQLPQTNPMKITRVKSTK